MVTHKVTIEDLYRQDEACLASQRMNDIDKYNQDIDVINEVIKEIIARAETYRPAYFRWVKPPKSPEFLISWKICSDVTDDDIDWSISLVSNGRLRYSYCDYDNYKQEYFELEHVHNLDNLGFNIWKYNLRYSIVYMAVDLFKIKPKSNWGYGL